MDSTAKKTKLVEIVLLLYGWGASIWFFMVLGYQCVTWLRTGAWVPLPLSRAFDFMTGGSFIDVFFRMEWVGLREVILWILNLPMSVMLPVLVFFLVGAICSWVENSAKKG